MNRIDVLINLGKQSVDRGALSYDHFGITIKSTKLNYEV